MQYGLPGGSALTHSDFNTWEKAPETTIKTAVPVSLSPWRWRDLLKVCAALWGLKHTTEATEEK